MVTLITALIAVAGVLATPSPAPAGPDPAPPADAAPRGMWDRLADCESGVRDADGTPVPGTARWDEADGGTVGHRGGLQWAAGTWRAVHPAGAPSDPAAASRSQEIAAAETLMEQPWGGFHHWPECSRTVGLR